MSRNVLPVQYQHAEGRADFERARRALKARLDADPLQAEGELAELCAALDMGVARIKRELLATALCWNENNQRLSAWIHEQNRRMAEMGEQLVYAAARTDEGASPRSVALALFHWGEAAKWAIGRERRDYLPLHGMISPLLARGRHREPLTLPVDGRGREATVEGIYFRALLIDRFGSGNLTRQQLEVLDAWLWVWMPRLASLDAAPEGAYLRVDLDADAGLREGSAEHGARSLHLPLAALEELRRAVIKELHRGRLVPPHGCAAEMRIEEHVAVLDRLRRAFEPGEEEREKRAQRRQAAGTRTEVWVGLDEILACGIGVGRCGAGLPALSLIESPLVPTQGKAAPMPVAEGVDPSRRYLWLADMSATGFEALESDATGIEVGDLVGWKRDPAGPCLLGKVTRRLPSRTDGQVFIGVHLLSEAAQTVQLRQPNAFDDTAGTFLYVAGDDASGRRDAFLVPDRVYDDPATFEACIGGEGFTLRFNRIRGRGRGWVLAGFEVAPARRIEMPRAADGAIEFVLEDEDPLERALAREVGTRLLAS